MMVMCLWIISTNLFCKIMVFVCYLRKSYSCIINIRNNNIFKLKNNYYANVIWLYPIINLADVCAMHVLDIYKLNYILKYL